MAERIDFEIITHLGIEQSRYISDEAFSMLFMEQMPNLVFLSLNENNLMSNLTLNCIAKNCVNLEELDISDNDSIGNEGLVVLLKNLKKLRHLDLECCP